MKHEIFFVYVCVFVYLFTQSLFKYDSNNINQQKEEKQSKNKMYKNTNEKKNIETSFVFLNEHNVDIVCCIQETCNCAGFSTIKQLHVKGQKEVLF